LKALTPLPSAKSAAANVHATVAYSVNVPDNDAENSASWFVLSSKVA